MPTPEKTTRDAIVTAGRELVESLGAEGLTMQAVADRVGVRAPSLYKRVRDRHELLELVVAANLDDLTARMSAQRQDDPGERLIAIAEALRGFAHEWPVGYTLALGIHGGPRPSPSSTAQSVAPLLEAITALSGSENALAGARLMTAWATGFLTMELGDRLQMGGDVDAAWRWGLERIVAALRG